MSGSSGYSVRFCLYTYKQFVEVYSKCCLQEGFCCPLQLTESDDYMKIPSSLRVISPCCLSRMEAVRDKWMIPIRGACKVPKNPDRQNWMTDEVGFWNLHRLTMTATSFFWGDLQRHGRTVALWPSDFLSHDWAMMHVQLCSHLATQQCQVCPSPLTNSERLAMQQLEGDVSYPNLLQQPIAPVAVQPMDWDPQEGGAQARLCCMNSVMLRHVQLQ